MFEIFNTLPGLVGNVYKIVSANELEAVTRDSWVPICSWVLADTVSVMEVTGEPVVSSTQQDGREVTCDVQYVNMGQHRDKPTQRLVFLVTQLMPT